MAVVLFSDRDGRMYGEYGVHMPNGWTKVLLYETSDNKVLRLVHEYRTPTNQLSRYLLQWYLHEYRTPTNQLSQYLSVVVLSTS